MEAARDIQSDVLSVLKRTSRFTVDTPSHTLWNLTDHDVTFRYGQLNHFRRLCERAMHSCMDGQKVAPKVPQYMYFNRIFEDLLECLQMEHESVYKWNTTVYSLSKKVSKKYFLRETSATLPSMLLLEILLRWPIAWMMYYFLQ